MRVARRFSALIGAFALTSALLAAVPTGGAVAAEEPTPTAPALPRFSDAPDGDTAPAESANPEGDGSQGGGEPAPKEDENFDPPAPSIPQPSETEGDDDGYPVGAHEEITAWSTEATITVNAEGEPLVHVTEQIAVRPNQERPANGVFHSIILMSTGDAKADRERIVEASATNEDGEPLDMTILVGEPEDSGLMPINFRVVDAPSDEAPADVLQYTISYTIAAPFALDADVAVMALTLGPALHGQEIPKFAARVRIDEAVFDAVDEMNCLHVRDEEVSDCDLTTTDGEVTLGSDSHSLAPNEYFVLELLADVDGFGGADDDSANQPEDTVIDADEPTDPFAQTPEFTRWAAIGGLVLVLIGSGYAMQRSRREDAAHASFTDE